MTTRNLKICRTVAKCFGVKVEQMLSESRRFAFSRHMAITLAWERSDKWVESVAEIQVAEEFGMADRTSVRYARLRIEERRQFGTLRDKQVIALCEDAVRRAKL